MTDRFEESLGKYTYVTLPQVKDYLSISSNTQDARLSNIVSYATGVIEHYIGQEVLANDYVEVFDGGTSSLFVSRLPLNSVYQISEFNGYDNQLLADPSINGVPVVTVDSTLVLDLQSGAKINNKVKRFGKSSILFSNSSFASSSVVPEKLRFDESDFTIEMFVRVDTPTISNATLFSIATDNLNYMNLSLVSQTGLAFTSSIAGTPVTVSGANNLIESQVFSKRKWAHVAVSRVLETERLYLHYNGVTIANSAYSVEDHTFTSNITLGNSLQGYIDEIRVSDVGRYTTDFTVPTYRFRPDSSTVCLIHVDGKNTDTSCSDVHAIPNEYSFARDTGEIIKDAGTRTTGRSYKAAQRGYSGMTLAGPSTFYPYPSGVVVDYRAGYEENNIPYDLQLATLDFIKIIYKQDQEKKGFSFEGERADNFSLSSNFPPHITRVLDLYRIIK